jgi:hypothetical protein
MKKPSNKSSNGARYAAAIRGHSKLSGPAANQVFCEKNRCDIHRPPKAEMATARPVNKSSLKAGY